MADALLRGSDVELGANHEAYEWLRNDLAAVGVLLNIEQPALERRTDLRQLEPLEVRLLSELALHSLDKIVVAVKQALRRRTMKS